MHFFVVSSITQTFLEWTQNVARIFQFLKQIEILPSDVYIWCCNPRPYLRVSAELVPQRHLQDLTTMLESCSTRGVRPMKYMMVRGSRSWGTQQGVAEASGFSLLYKGRIML